MTRRADPAALPRCWSACREGSFLRVEKVLETQVTEEFPLQALSTPNAVPLWDVNDLVASPSRSHFDRIHAGNHAYVLCPAIYSSPGMNSNPGTSLRLPFHRNSTKQKADERRRRGTRRGECEQCFPASAATLGPLTLPVSSGPRAPGGPVLRATLGVHSHRTHSVTRKTALGAPARMATRF